MKRTNRGWSLLELMLVLAFIVIASGIAYKIFKPSQIQAAVRQEQQNVGRMVDGIMGAYSTASSFSTLSSATAAGILNLPLNGSTLDSALHKNLTVQPATTVATNDSFDLIYASLSTQQCQALIPALKSRSQGVFVGSNSNLQDARGAITNESLIATQCAASPTTNVTFRFRADKNTFAATTTDSCLCAPETETQTLACPTGSGSITQRRTATCTGGTPMCPSAQWSSWVTASNTCAADGNPIAPTTPVAPVAPNTCVPTMETQVLPCAAGQVGGTLQQRTRVCPANTWGAWNTLSSSCQPDPNRPACTPSTQRQTAACPAGQGGQIVQERASTCDVNGNQVWSNDWKNISSTCTASCVAAGTCCTVSRQASTDLQYCGVGNYGSIQRDLYRTSTCSAPNATPVWPGTWSESRRNGTCTACPSPVQEQQTQSVAASAACPSGQTGSHTWTSNQMRTRTQGYNCSSDRITTLPAPSYSDWSAWTEVARSGESNTCAAVPTNVCAVSIDSEYQTGTSDTRDAYYNIDYMLQGVPGGCMSNYRDNTDPGYCDGRTLSLSAWTAAARDGERYSTSGSQSGWEAGGGEFWTWEYQVFERRSGAACDPTPTNPPVAAPAATCGFVGGEYSDWTLLQPNGSCTAMGTFYRSATHNVSALYQVKDVDTSRYSISWSGDCTGNGISCQGVAVRTSMNAPYDRTATVTITDRSTGQSASTAVTAKFRVTGISKN